jgi:hypothetical protein
MLNAAPIFHFSVLLSRLLGKVFGEKLPQDFNCLHFSRSEIRNLAKRIDMQVKESVLASSHYGILESVRYLNFAKYRRKFGVAESEAFMHPQNVLEDLKLQAGRYRALTHAYYLISKVFPSLFSYFSVNMVEKSK